MFAKNGPKKGEFSSVLHDGASIEGTLTFTGSVFMNGRMKGEILSNDLLVIGEKGVVEATVHAGTVQVAGVVIGDIVASQRVELAASARVTGNIQAPVVAIEDGAVFEGHCHMSQARLPDVPALPGRSASIVPLRSVN